MMKQKQFSLVELLVVVAIITLLLSLLQPALRKAIIQAQIAVCMNNQRQVGEATFVFADDYYRIFSFNNATGDYPHEGWWRALDEMDMKKPGNPALALMPNYIMDSTVFFCPLSVLEHDKDFERNPHPFNVQNGTTNADDKVWGSYVWKYPHVPKVDGHEHSPFNNQIGNASDESRDMMMMDISGSWGAYYKKSLYTFWEGEHYTVLFTDGSVKMVANTEDQALFWLHGPTLRPW